MSTTPFSDLPSYDTISALRAETNPAPTVLLRGYNALGDSSPRVLIWKSADTTTDNSGTVFKLTSVTTGRYNFIFDGAVYAEWFGALNGRSSDNSAAIQKAINYCLSFSQAIPLKFHSSCLITSSLIVDRPVNTPTSRFRIMGEGAGAGLYVNTAIYMFDSSISFTSDPVSENIGFEGMQFEASSASLAAYVMNGKFFRIYFNGSCHFHLMKCLNSSIYTQSWYIDDSATAIGWNGLFFNSVGAFDINIGAMRREAYGANFAGPFMNTVNSGGGGFGTYGVRLRGGLYEGATSPLLETNKEHGVSIDGVYTEGNTNLDVKFASGGNGGSGVSVSKMYSKCSSTNQSNSSFYNVDWGNVAGGTSGANYCEGRLHDNDSMTSPLVNGGADYASLAIYKDETLVTNSESAWITYTPTIVPGIGTFTSASATGRYKRYNGKMIMFEATGTITNNGTGTTNVKIGLPTTPAQPSNVNGDEIAGTGFTLSGTIVAGFANTVMLNYDGTYPGASGHVLQISGFYESST